MTSWEMSIRLHNRSEITSLACSTAPCGSPVNQNFLKTSVDEIGY
uniref:Uncharacterized protein n=1 Tax=Anguilla anguilla TaxID=7936 RepID=A0A0E9W2W1_ANGAN